MPSLHRYTVADLPQELSFPTSIENAKASGMTNENKFSVNQIGALLVP